MEAVANKALSFRQAEAWDRRQQQAMTPQQRIKAARLLQRRLFGPARDVRECRKND